MLRTTSALKRIGVRWAPQNATELQAEGVPVVKLEEIRLTESQ